MVCRSTTDPLASHVSSVVSPNPGRPVVRFELAYHGSAYHGWQIQNNAVTVQGAVQATLESLLQRKIKVNGASRTDAGVHAMGQVVSFPYPEQKLSPYVLHRALNGMLPRDLTVLRLEVVPGLDHRGRPFHARHCARGKVYRYTVWPLRVPNAFLRSTAWHLRRVPTEQGWNDAAEAAKAFAGEHDFQGFRAADCESATTVRVMKGVEILRSDEPGTPVVIEVEGSAFLKNMVRIMAGSLVEIATGARSPDMIERVLARGDRREAGRTAPACGLRLETIHYPEFPWKRDRWEMPPQ